MTETKEFEPSYQKIVEDLEEVSRRYWDLRGKIYEEIETIEKIMGNVRRRLGQE